MTLYMDMYIRISDKKFFRDQIDKSKISIPVHLRGRHDVITQGNSLQVTFL